MSQIRYSNTIAGCLNSLVHHGALTDQQARGIREGLSRPWSRQQTYNLLVARFNLQETQGCRWSFEIPTHRRPLRLDTLGGTEARNP